VNPDGAPAMTSTDGLPVPESLLVPLLDSAADVLATLGDADRPPVLRPLGGFDRRRLQSSTARKQLRRALDVDDGFRERVVERFLDRPDVEAALDGWVPDAAMQRVDDAAERSDLPWLASALYAARPEGWSFGLGVVCSVFERQRSEQERDDDLEARESQLAAADEARRRAEQAREQSVAAASRLEDQLRDERRGRRDRERQAARDIEDAARRRKDAEAATQAAQDALAAAQAQVAREAERARAAEQRVRALRRERKEVEAASPPAPPLPAPDVEALAAAIEDARSLTAALERVTRAARDALGDHERSAAEAPPRRRSSSPRAPVPCPAGMQADTADALDAMLRTRGITLVVDGYNVSMAGWPDVAVADQRERLVAELARLHLRLRCDVVVVFDGADVEGVTPPRRTGVRVVFSHAGEEADPVVIREVGDLPLSTPAIVASSDQWVRDHAEDEGATVVSSASLLAVLRR